MTNEKKSLLAKRIRQAYKIFWWFWLAQSGRIHDMFTMPEMHLLWSSLVCRKVPVGEFTPQRTSFIPHTPIYLSFIQLFIYWYKKKEKWSVCICGTVFISTSMCSRIYTSKKMLDFFFWICLCKQDRIQLGSIDK